MKLLLAVLCVAAVAFADDGCNETFSGIPQPPTDAVTLTVVNNFDISGKTLGVDIFENASSTYILGADNENDYIQAWDGTTGGALGTMPLDGGNGSCFCCAWNDDPDTDTYYTDDWSSSNLFYTENFGSTWTTTPSPVGSNGRGMAFDGTDYWITESSTGICRFQPGVGEEHLSTPEIPSQLSGIAVFPYMSDLGVAVTSYQTLNIYFYQWDGSTLSFLGSAACPGSPYRSYGLVYSANTGNLFWSYSPTSGDYWLAELSFDITALSRDTWAGIKTAF